MDSSASTSPASHLTVPATHVAPAGGPAAQPSPRPLIVKFGAMGDMVMLTSMVKALSARFGSAVDVLSSGPWTRPLLEGQPGIGTVYRVKHRSMPFIFSPDQRALVRALRERGAGPTWYCDRNENALPLLHRAGFSGDLIFKAQRLPMHKHEHLVDYWQRMARCSPLGAPPAAPLEAGTAGAEGVSGGDPELVVPPAAAEDLERWLTLRGLAGRQLLLVQPGNKRTMRRGFRRRPSNTKWWPEERWAAVVRAMSQSHPQAAILMLGVPQEHDLNRQIIELARLPDPAAVEGGPAVALVVNVAGDLPIPRLLALQARASAMLSVDTGPAHSAAAVGCPVLVLFGVADPARNRPRGVSTAVRHLAGQEGGSPSILGISVEQVIAEWHMLPKR